MREKNTEGGECKKRRTKREKNEEREESRKLERWGE